MSFRESLESEFAPYGSLSPRQLDLLEAHHQLLTRWNQKLNLTRISDLEETVRLHYCESLFAGLQLPAGPLRVADLGSGAGFPGIPIAVLRPDLELTLIEAHQRKAVFLREAARTIPKVRVLAVRAEDCREKHEQYDWVVSRAVAPQDVLKARLAPNTMLLISGGDVPEGSKIIPIPWGENRVLAVG